jgi:hypothetical protein
MRFRRRLPLPAWLALLAALLLAQALGQWHRTVHTLPHAHPAQHHEAHADEHHEAHAFDDHEAGGSECRLLDQLAQADGLSPPPPTVHAAGSAPRSAAEARRSARLAPAWRALARGPPAA